VKYDGHQITIDRRLRTDGPQHLVIEFEREFSSEPGGFYRYVDNQDHKVYAYTDLEPYGANHVFPCFDQPDLKATFKMTVHAPQTWEIISNTIPSHVEDGDGERVWEFPMSPKNSEIKQIIPQDRFNHYLIIAS
jgi:aminopeptidase N